MDNNFKNIITDGIPNLSDENRLAILNIFENLGLHNILEIYTAMDYKLTDDGKPSDDTVPDDWTKKNFEGIIDIQQQMYLCTNILGEAGEEIRAGKFEALKQKLKELIISLLNEKNYKMAASDIDAHLKHQNVDEVKELCEEMYHNGEISRTGNYRYFILTEEKKTTKKAAVKKTGSVADEIKKFKDLLDAGAITQEEYDAKKKELLGL